MNLSIFSERLSDLIFDGKIKTEDFAKAIGCSRSSAFELKSGDREPTLDTLVRIADFFHCTTDYLVGLDEVMYQSMTFTPCPPFAERIPAICAHFKISRYRLQQMTKIPESTLYAWAHGKTVPSVENLVKMAQALDCSLDFIIGRAM